jgi:hypothetical protein
MTETVPLVPMDYDPVRVHVVQASAPPKNRSSNAYSVSVANVVADTQPRQVLANAPSRVRATLIVTGTAGETAFLCDSQGLASQRSGALIGPMSAPIEVTSTDELWLAQGTGTSIVVGVIAEYE